MKNPKLILKILLFIASVTMVSCASRKPIDRAKKQITSLKPEARASLSGDYDRRLWGLLSLSHDTDTLSRAGDKTKLTVLPKQERIKISLFKNKTELDHFYKPYTNHGHYIEFTKRSHVWGKPPFLWGYSPGNEVLALDKKSGHLRFYDIETEQIWVGFLPVSTRGTGRPRTLTIKKIR